MEIKLCHRCKQKLNVVQFCKDRTQKDGLQRWCRECYQKYRKENREAFHKRDRKYSQKKKEENWEQILELFGDYCGRCGRRYHRAIYQFHHIDPSTKKFNIGHRLDNSWEILEPELFKCEMLCAPCHIMLHWNEEHS